MGARRPCRVRAPYRDHARVDAPRDHDGTRALPRRRSGMARQGGRLRDPSRRCGVGDDAARILYERRRPAPRAGPRPTPRTADSAMNAISSRLADILARIERARARSGDRSPVRLIGVSKKQPAEAIRAAYAAGLRDSGDNYAQE